MRRAPIIPFSRLMDALPGWMCVICGAVLLGLFTLTPPWLACRDTAWQRDLMKLQAAALTEQRDRYQQFHDALAADDPVLIERLAFSELRQKPVGQKLLAERDDVLLASNTQFIPDASEAALLTPASSTLPGSVHAWLRVPMPRIGHDVEPLRPVESHVTRIVHGPYRMIAVVFAIAVLGMGIMMQVRDKRKATAPIEQHTM